MNGKTSDEIIKMLCEEDWEAMPREVFQHKIGLAVTWLLRNSASMNWRYAGLVSLSGFLGGACVWIALIIASGKIILG